MRERRWPWVGTSVLLLAAAVAAGWSTYLHWQPCRGALLSGSVVRAYKYAPDFSDACLRRMDGSLPFPFLPEAAQRTPWASELGVVAMSLAAAAWLLLVVGTSWSLRTKLVAALPGLTTLALAAALALATVDPGLSADDDVSMWILLTPEVAALAAIAAILAWQPELDERTLARVLVVAWGTTAFGAVHLVVEYAFMLAFSDANWDTPPLTGSVTVATLVVAAVLTLRMALHPSPVPGSTNHPSPAVHPYS